VVAPTRVFDGRDRPHGTWLVGLADVAHSDDVRPVRVSEPLDTEGQMLLGGQAATASEDWSVRFVQDAGRLDVGIMKP
jgi:hypothetical protein